MKLYQYKNCGTCRKALKYLDAKEQDIEILDITVTPPSLAELTVMLEAYEGNVRKLFNTSGVQYRELKLKDSLPNMDAQSALELLAGNGKLVKRPFLIDTKQNSGIVGFKEADWDTFFESA